MGTTVKRKTSHVTIVFTKPLRQFRREMRGRTLGRDNARQDFQAIDEPRFNTDYQSQREGQGRCSIHLLVKDTGGGVIPPSNQLIAGRTAQEYNQRKNRHGAFWQDRYHAPQSKPTSTCSAV